MNLKRLLRRESRFYKSLVIIYIFFVFALILFSANLFKNFRSLTNISDSMHPTIDKGSVTIVKKYESYNVGDVIAYYTNNRRKQIITHRIISIGGNVYTTKGDANQIADREIVVSRLVIGKVVLIIPYLGHIISIAKSRLGALLMIIIPAMIILIIESLRIYRLKITS